TLPLEEVVVVEGLRPFYRAFNAGVQRTSAPFVLQVDSDFVLDPDCAQTLRDGMADAVGITAAPLRDSLIGPVCGVKLFRRKCLPLSPLRDTIAPEVELYRTLERRGWQIRYLTGTGKRAHGPTVGVHRAQHTLDHVFGTYFLLGMRYVLHNDPMGILWRLSELRRSRQRLAGAARIAMAHGMFAHEARNETKPAPTPADAAFLERVAASRQQRSASSEAHAMARKLAALSLVPLLDACIELGRALREASPSRFGALLHAVGERRAPWSWIAEAGLGHGALSAAITPAPDATVAMLEQLGSGGLSRLFPR